MFGVKWGRRTDEVVRGCPCHRGKLSTVEVIVKGAEKTKDDTIGAYIDA
jgi:hypothetical protein